MLKSGLVDGFKSAFHHCLNVRVAGAGCSGDYFTEKSRKGQHHELRVKLNSGHQLGMYYLMHEK